VATLAEIEHAGAMPARLDQLVGQQPDSPPL
jgi:hypothetical protein